MMNTLEAELNKIMIEMKLINNISKIDNLIDEHLKLISDGVAKIDIYGMKKSVIESIKQCMELISMHDKTYSMICEIFNDEDDDEYKASLKSCRDRYMKILTNYKMVVEIA